MHETVRKAVKALVGLVLAGGAVEVAVAGPPLTIDDPGILDPGKFEIILAGTSESRDSGDVFLLPIIDVSYGWSENVQFAVVATRIVNDPDGEEEKSDVGPAAVGVKWRFLDQDALQMSVAPFYEFIPRDGAADREVIDDIDAWGLPVQFQYEFSQWRLNAEVGYILAHQEGDAWKYGVAAAYPLNERLELLAEIRHNTDIEFDQGATGYLFGFDFSISESLHLLASAGSTIHESGDDDEDLRTYLGLQWFP